MNSSPGARRDASLAQGWDGRQRFFETAMGTAPIAWPRKSREMHCHHFDSTVWNGFAFRDDDIVISTYAKSGTIWVQQIVAQLIFDGAEDLPVADMSPWLDLRVPPKEVKLAAPATQSHRRFTKTHLPVDALVCSPKAKYLYIGRDGRDVVWSMHSHHMSGNELWYRLLNDSPGRVGPPILRPNDSVREYFLAWLDKDGYPFWRFWENIRSWWAIWNLPNLMMLHFADLKADMPGQIRRIAGFLDIPIDERKFSAITRHCSIDYMKANADKSVPLAGAIFAEGAASFIHKGRNGRWRDVLSAEDSRRYDEMAKRELGEDCARWIAHGD